MWKSVDSSTVEEWRKEQVFQIIKDYEPLEHLYCWWDRTARSSGSQPTGHEVWKGFLAMERIPRTSSNLLACSVTLSVKLLLLGRLKTFIVLKMSVCHEIWSQLQKHGLQRLSLLIILVDAKRALKMEKYCIFRGPVWCLSSRCMLPSSMEVYYLLQTAPAFSSHLPREWSSHANIITTVPTCKKPYFHDRSQVISWSMMV